MIARLLSRARATVRQLRIGIPKLDARAPSVAVAPPCDLCGAASVTTRLVDSDHGAVDVDLCAPCAARPASIVRSLTTDKIREDHLTARSPRIHTKDIMTTTTDSTPAVRTAADARTDLAAAVARVAEIGDAYTEGRSTYDELAAAQRAEFSLTNEVERLDAREAAEAAERAAIAQRCAEVMAQSEADAARTKAEAPIRKRISELMAIVNEAAISPEIMADIVRGKIAVARARMRARAIGQRFDEVDALRRQLREPPAVQHPPSIEIQLAALDKDCDAILIDGDRTLARLIARRGGGMRPDRDLEQVVAAFAACEGPDLTPRAAEPADIARLAAARGERLALEQRATELRERRMTMLVHDRGRESVEDQMATTAKALEAAGVAERAIESELADRGVDTRLIAPVMPPSTGIVERIRDRIVGMFAGEAAP